MYVHASKFHSDDCLVAAMGKILGFQVVRTDDRNIVNTIQADDVVCDTGRKYDGVRFFDHHQDGCPTAGDLGILSRNSPTLPMAAAGLFWFSYGTSIVRAIDPTCPMDCAKEIAYNLDRCAIAFSDAIDTGDGFVPFNVFSVPFVISAFNPCDGTPADFDNAFHYVVDNILVPFFRNFVIKTVKTYLSRAIVEASPIVNGNIIVLDKYVPWISTVTHCSKFDGCLYTVYPSLRGGWSAQAIPLRDPESKDNGFQTRKPFPEEWAGKNEMEMASAAGELYSRGDNFFCHKGRFIISAPSKEAAIRMCVKAAER